MTELEKNYREIIKNKALYFLGRREYSAWGLGEKLREKFPENFAEISEVIKNFAEKDWLSDERFCENLVREKAQYSGWGKGKIVLKLKENKISEELIQENFAKYFAENVQIKKAQKLAKEKEIQLTNGRKKLTDYEKQQKIKLFLVSRGFSFQIAQNAVEALKK